jgi:pimeloyl-ACP methyl ester carboxylesterase
VGVRSITSSASLPGDVGRLGAARYVRLGTVARLARMKFPEGHDAQDPLLRPAAARRTAAAISCARLVILPGVGHYLPAAVYPQVADEVRALADRAATAAPKTD